MPRPVWTGTISFGLVAIPVKVFPAIESHRPVFHEVESGTGRRIRYKRVAEGSGREVPWEKIERGFEVGKGRIVALSKEELAAAEPKRDAYHRRRAVREPRRDRPVSWDQTYYVAPDGAAGEKSYALFREALKRSGRVAIGRFVMRTKERVVCLRPFQDVIALQTMFFPDEVRDVHDLPDLPKAGVGDVRGARPRADAGAADHRLAQREVGPLEVPGHVPRPRDEAGRGEGEGRRDRRRARAGRWWRQVVDLLAALKASLAKGKGAGDAEERAEERRPQGQDRARGNRHPPRSAPIRRPSLVRRVAEASVAAPPLVGLATEAPSVADVARGPADFDPRRRDLRYLCAHSAGVAKWYTQRTQNPPLARAYEFKSRLRH